MLPALKQILTHPPTIIAGGVSGSTWDPANKGANIVLSAGNLKATVTGDSTCVYGTQSHTGSGKYYFEITINDYSAGAFSIDIGIGQLSFGTGTYPGADSSGGNAGFFDSGGSGGFTIAGTFAAVNNGFALNNILSIAVDFDHSKIFSAVNGVWSIDTAGSTQEVPASNTGGIAFDNTKTWFPMFGSASNSSSAAATVNFNGTMTYLPSGFSNWG